MLISKYHFMSYFKFQALHLCIIFLMLQDPESIKCEAAGPSGDVYTVVTKVKKVSEKNGKSEELPMHSEEDKSSKKEQERVSM